MLEIFAKEYGMCPVHILDTWSEDLMELMARKMCERLERQEQATKEAQGNG